MCAARQSQKQGLFNIVQAEAKSHTRKKGETKRIPTKAHTLYARLTDIESASETVHATETVQKKSTASNPEGRILKTT
jgi:hypothetical protein